VKPYKDRTGKSGVLAYETHDEAIDVTFKDGVTYRYTHASAGWQEVETMKMLAAQGRGLSGFISKHAFDRYADKW
jgi:hypothetical protein